MYGGTNETEKHTLSVVQKIIKTNTDKEKHVFLFVKPPCFVGFSLFLLVFELKIGGRRESQRLRMGATAETNGRWPKGKAMGNSNGDKQ